MKKHIWVLLCPFLPLLAWSQKRNQANWQQHVAYEIRVTLDDREHMLRGNETILYTNNSPNTLTELYMHVWPNAYRNNQTAFAKQQLENGKTDFLYLSDQERGYIDSLAFLLDGKTAQWELTKDIDIARITLNQPLKPGESTRISTPFKVKLPKVVSRMGHEDQLYCVTQWYPKPAVYDVNGWNPMPYLDQGEFYSEFGTFDVYITLPQNYVVASTGVLQNEEEKAWLMAKSKNKFPDSEGSKIFPPSAPQTKTLHYRQDRIHDFAWFADKRFSVERSEVVLPISKRTVTTWMFEVAPKSSSVAWIDTAILFYSDMLGEYPYSDASVAVTPLVSGTGMEYPMVTNITAAGRQVIVHEVGHNWLYGILASNERAYPWMDESINNYYETRSAEYEGIHPYEPLRLQNLASFGSDGYRGLETRYLIGARNNRDQKAMLHAASYDDYNYGAIIYGKASSAFHYLQRYLGDSLFDAMMRAYYEKWKFKHPLPDDFISHAQQFTGKDLNWFFEGLMNTTYKQDWRIKRLRKTPTSTLVYLKNKAPFNAPVSITALNNNIPLHTIWVDSVTDNPVVFPNGLYDRIRVDAFEITTDINRENNTIRTSGLFKKWEPLSFRLFADAEQPYKNQVFWSPVVGMNLYNKTMLGAAFYNGILPNKQTSFLVTPLYALGTKDLAGSGELQHNWLTYGKLRKVTAEVKAAQFASEYIVPTTYTRMEAGVKAELTPRNQRTSPLSTLFVRAIGVDERSRKATIGDNVFYFVEAGLTVNQKVGLDPYQYTVWYQYGDRQTQFHKVNLEAKRFFHYATKGKGFTARVAGISFLHIQDRLASDGRDVIRAGGNTGLFDYTFDQSQFGRGENPVISNSLFAQQLLFGGLEFKELYPGITTDKWAIGTNLETTLPGKIPVVIYADIAFVKADDSYVDGNTGSFVTQYKNTLLYTGGLSIKLFEDVFRINLPILASQEITNYFNGKNAGNVTGAKRYTERISFSFNLNALNPVKGARNISF